MAVRLDTRTELRTYNADKLEEMIELRDQLIKEGWQLRDFVQLRQPLDGRWLYWATFSFDLPAIDPKEMN
ncbi:hypothetical protein FDH82_gp39 [Roseobacter phage RDJL Phi 2]|uniref:Uncharacterized protein n=1 Tax=Roseobacter phage RDJL Phi 2 TaxID=1682380 RepID=A0A0K0PVS8_9CAUD|nr:hypothetical protein FDH82_gp39 [Roseobacter phage RDJL Phi 2]AKQ75829.1 hypothetical protein RDJLphi2_gp39 [Roseobacter phage RDJL Phi 2]